MAYIQITDDEIIINTGIHEPRLKIYNKGDYKQLRAREKYEEKLSDLISFSVITSSLNNSKPLFIYFLNNFS